MGGGQMGFLANRDWVPHVPGLHMNGPQIIVQEPGGRMMSYYDCLGGQQLGPAAVTHSESNVTISFSIEARGFGCLLRVADGTANSTSLKVFLKNMQGLTAGKPLSSYS